MCNEEGASVVLEIGVKFSYCKGCTFCLSEVNGVALEEEVFYFCWDSFCSPVLCFRAAFGGIGMWVA